MSVNADHFGTTGNDVMDNIINSVMLNVTGAIDPLSAGTGAGPGFSQFTNTVFFEDALAVIESDLHDVVGDVFGDVFGGEGDDFFDIFFDDPFDDFQDSFFFADEFGFEDDFFFEEDVFSLDPVFDFFGDDDDFTSEPVITQSSFDEILIGTASSDILDGSDLNTNFYFNYADIGGADTITDAGGINQIAFDDLNDTVIKFTIDSSLSTTGSIEIWGGAGRAGYSSLSGADATYTLTNTAYTSVSPDSTISFSNVGQYLFADTPTPTLSGGFSTQGEEDLTATQTDSDSGDVIVMPALEINDIGYVVAGGSGADIFNLDDSAMDGAIVFGKGGGDTFNIKASIDALLIGGITTTDNNDNLLADGSTSGQDGIPDANINVFDYSTLFSGATGLSGTIIGFFDSFDNKYETTAVMTGSSGNLNTILWDVGSFVGSAGNDTITLTGEAALNSFDSGSGNDSISVTSAVKLLTLNVGAGNDNLTIAQGALTGKTVTLDGGSGTDTLSLTGGGTLTSGEVANFTSWGTWSLATNAATSLTLNTANAGTGTLLITAIQISTGNLVKIDAAAETDGGFIQLTISGSALNTGTGTAAILTGGSGGGSDTLTIRAFSVDLNLDSTELGGITAFETWTLNSTQAYNLTLNTANAGTGTLTIDASSATSLTLDGTAETDGGKFIVTGSGGNDVISGGTGADIIIGGSGSDKIAVDGGTGDIVRYSTSTDGTSLVTITDTTGTTNDFAAVASVDTDPITNDWAVASDFINISGGLLTALGGSVLDAVSAAGNLDYSSTNVWLTQSTDGKLAGTNFGDVSDVIQAFNGGNGTVVNATANDEILFTIENTSGTQTGLYYFKDVDGNGDISNTDQIALLAIIDDASLTATEIT